MANVPLEVGASAPHSAPNSTDPVKPEFVEAQTWARPTPACSRSNFANPLADSHSPTQLPALVPPLTVKMIGILVIGIPLIAAGPTTSKKTVNCALPPACESPLARAVADTDGGNKVACAV